MKDSHYQSSISVIPHHLFFGFKTLITILALNACGSGSPLTLNKVNMDKIQRDRSAKEVNPTVGEPTETKTEPLLPTLSEPFSQRRDSHRECKSVSVN
jgi:hypothetical protein